MKYFLLSALFFLASCVPLTPEKIPTDKLLFEQGSKLHAAGDYADAIQYFDSLRNRFPQSPYLLDAELKTAEARFEKEEYAEAEVDFQNFRSLHPTNPKVPYVTLMLGMTHYKRIPKGIDRDQMQTERALAVFDEISRRWPGSPESAKVEPLMARCRRDLLLRQLYIADFYLNRKQYGASLQRLVTVRSSPEFKDLSAEATYKLGYAHYKLGNAEQAKEMLNATVENPDAKKYHEKAKGILKKL